MADSPPRSHSPDRSARARCAVATGRRHERRGIETMNRNAVFQELTKPTRPTRIQRSERCVADRLNARRHYSNRHAEPRFDRSDAVGVTAVCATSSQVRRDTSSHRADRRSWLGSRTGPPPRRQGPEQQKCRILRCITAEPPPARRTPVSTAIASGQRGRRVAVTRLEHILRR